MYGTLSLSIPVWLMMISSWSQFVGVGGRDPLQSHIHIAASPAMYSIRVNVNYVFALSLPFCPKANHQPSKSNYGVKKTNINLLVEKITQWVRLRT